MSTEELSLFESQPEGGEDTFEPVVIEPPGSPEIPIGVSHSGASRRKRGPRRRVLESPSGSESDDDARDYARYSTLAQMSQVTPPFYWRC
jgi:hypothetical protein